MRYSDEAGTDREGKVAVMKIQKVAVLGCGTMGSQIAMQCALCGYQVQNYDLDPGMVKKAEQFSSDWFASRVRKGKLTPEAADEAGRRLVFTGDLREAVSDADLVIEAVPDLIEIKKKVLNEVDGYTHEHTIYASNSSYIVSSLFADAVKRPEQVANFHFFNPALVMQLVEIVKGSHVSQDTVDTLMEFAVSIGKTPVLVKKEIYGFVVNRIFSAITKEACYLLDQDIASVEDIDLAVKKGLNHPLGPLELLDMTGIDLEYHVLMERYRMTGNLSDKPSAAVVERYARGEYGRKSGAGFYRYGEE